VINKIKNHTHLEVKNYWTPLNEEEDKAEEEETHKQGINKIESTTKKNKPSNRPGGRQRSKKAKQTTLKLVIDSGATSHFLREEENLPETGKISTTIYLPDDSTLKATTKTQLPIPELSSKARDAIVVPGLKRNLGSVSKFSQAGYTTVFHPGEEGVTIHEPNTFQITTTTPPILQGCKSKGLWTVTVDDTDKVGVREKVNNAYNIPSTKETIRYLHAAAGYPVQDTWVAAIKAGNNVTWPGINVKTVNQHFPESEETQKGHMKKQRQNVRSTRVKEAARSEENNPPPTAMKKEHDVYI
jgi:hypothetical protein